MTFGLSEMWIDLLGSKTECFLCNVAYLLVIHESIDSSIFLGFISKIVDEKSPYDETNNGNQSKANGNERAFPFVKVQSLYV